MFNYLFVWVGFISCMFQSDLYATCSNVNSVLNDTVPQLSEIIISGKRKPMLHKKDTIVFRAEAFKNGTEKNLEDLLEKIPGIKVDPYSGKLSYLGRTIQAVKLDGADLSGSDYVNLTRNISTDLIDEIEAIDNDPDNPLLKEIRPSGIIVLNLKLKKGKARVNGEVSVGLGASKSEAGIADVKANYLRLSEKLKSFSCAGVNNRGLNYAAHNYFEYQEHDQNQHDENKQQPIATSSIQSLMIPSERYFLNHNYMMNVNFLIQPKLSNSSIRFNAHGITDYLRTQYSQFNVYRPETKIPATSDDLNAHIHPVFYKSSLEWKQPLSPKLWMRYMAFADRNHQSEEVGQVLNQQLILNSRIAHQQFRHHHQLDLTYRLRQLMALRTVFNVEFHDLNENMSWEGSDDRDSLRTIKLQDIQQKRKVFECRTILSAKTNKHNYEFEAGYKHLQTTFHSVSFGTAPAIMNHIDQEYVQVYHSGGAHIRFGNWMMQPKLKIAVNRFQTFNSYKEKISNELIAVEPEMVISKKISDQLKSIHVFGISNRPLSDRSFFDHPVWVSARQLYTNNIMPDLQNVVKIQSMLICQDLFRQLHGQIDLSYVRMNQAVIPSMRIDIRNVQTNFSVLRNPVERYTIQASAEKFISNLQATLFLACNYSIYHYYNLINNKDLRDNALHVIEPSIKISKSLQKTINIVYDLKFVHNHIYSSVASQHTLAQITESFQIIWQKSKKGFVRLIAENYRPQLASSYAIVFLDAEILYKPAGKKFSCSIVGKNLLNHQYIKQVQISDYGSTEMMTRLLPGYLMLAWSYRF